MYLRLITGGDPDGQTPTQMDRRPLPTGLEERRQPGNRRQLRSRHLYPRLSLQGSGLPYSGKKDWPGSSSPFALGRVLLLSVG